VADGGSNAGWAGTRCVRALLKAVLQDCVSLPRILTTLVYSYYAFIKGVASWTKLATANVDTTTQIPNLDIPDVSQRNLENRVDERKSGHDADVYH
jgi:hypothetical protein